MGQLVGHKVAVLTHKDVVDFSAMSPQVFRVRVCFAAVLASVLSGMYFSMSAKGKLRCENLVALVAF